MIMGLEAIGGYGYLKIEVTININISTIITMSMCKNGSSIINARSNTTHILLYFCEIIFKDYYHYYKNFNN